MAESIVDALRKAASKLKSLKERQDTLRGRKDSILEQLKKQFSVDSLIEAEELLRKKEMELKKKEEEASELEQQMEEIMKKVE